MKPLLDKILIPLTEFALLGGAILVFIIIFTGLAALLSILLIPMIDWVESKFKKEKG